MHELKQEIIEVIKVVYRGGVGGGGHKTTMCIQSPCCLHIGNLGQKGETTTETLLKFLLCFILFQKHKKIPYLPKILGHLNALSCKFPPLRPPL